MAPNIYYMGVAGVVRYGGLRIAGLSGIYKEGDYRKGEFMSSPSLLTLSFSPSLLPPYSPCFPFSLSFFSNRSF